MNSIFGGYPDTQILRYPHHDTHPSARRFHSSTNSPNRRTPWGGKKHKQTDRGTTRISAQWGKGSIEEIKNTRFPNSPSGSDLATRNLGPVPLVFLDDGNGKRNRRAGLKYEPRAREFGDEKTNRNMNKTNPRERKCVC